MRKYPCKGCQDRNLGCHDRCEKYLDARNQNIEEHRNIITRRLEMGTTISDYAGHDRRMRGKYHGKVFKSHKR